MRTAPVSNDRIPIRGFSIAGVETSIEIPSLKLVLDMGRCSRTAVNQEFVVVSHGHLDHVLPRGDVVFSHVSARYAYAEIERIVNARLPDDLRGLVRMLV